MSRQGFALLAVLWVIAAIAGLVGLGVGLMRIDSLGSSNRLRLERARWGAEACIAIAQARWVDHRMTDTATIDLGRTATCRWRVDDPAAKLNANAASAGMLVSLGLSPSTADSLIAHRQFQDTAQVRPLLGPDSALLPLLTVDGPGTIDANAAPPMILKTIPGMGPEAVARLIEFRRLGRPVASLDQLVSITPGEQPDLLAHYSDLTALVTFAPIQLLITATGQVGPGQPHVTVEELVVPLPDRLAVIRRRLW